MGLQQIDMTEDKSSDELLHRFSETPDLLESWVEQQTQSDSLTKG